MSLFNTLTVTIDSVTAVFLQWVYAIHWLLQLTLLQLCFYSEFILIQYIDCYNWLCYSCVSTMSLCNTLTVTIDSVTAVFLQWVYYNLIHWLLQLTLFTAVLLQWVWVPDQWGGWQWRQPPPLPPPTLPQTLHGHGRHTQGLVLWLLRQVWHLLQRAPHGQVWRLLRTYPRWVDCWAQSGQRLNWLYLLTKLCMAMPQNTDQTLCVHTNLRGHCVLRTMTY